MKNQPAIFIKYKYGHLKPRSKRSSKLKIKTKKHIPYLLNRDLKGVEEEHASPYTSRSLPH